MVISAPRTGRIERVCGTTPAGRYVVRAYAESTDARQQPTVGIECIVDGRTVATRRFSLAAGFQSLDCPIDLPATSELVVRITAEAPMTNVRLWPPIGPMVACAADAPSPSSLPRIGAIVDEVRAWSEAPHAFASTSRARHAPCWRSAKDLGEWKTVVFNELYRHLEHRPVPLAAARFTRSALRMLAAPVRKLIRAARGD
jgi:hypothetical protein